MKEPRRFRKVEPPKGADSIQRIVTYIGGRDRYRIGERILRRGVRYSFEEFSKDEQAAMLEDSNLAIEGVNAEGKVLVHMDRMPPKDLAIGDGVIPILREEAP
jgi:hypothetical protein